MSQETIHETFHTGGKLDQALENYAVRDQQIEMAHKVDEAMDNGRHLLVEAPTGVGKSMAALVPAFERIKRYDRPVVIVTSSIVLQEQYINKDIPFLESVFGMDTKPVLIKGRNNYVCLRKYQSNKSPTKLSSDRQVQEYQQVKSWAAKTETGDRSELHFVPSYNVWSEFAAMDSSECATKQCPLYNQCFYYQERNKVPSSNLVICNYHYFLQAKQNGAPGMLPDNPALIILDEAHEASHIARDFTEQSYTMYSLQNMVNEWSKAYQSFVLDQGSDDPLVRAAYGAMADVDFNHLQATATDMFVKLNDQFERRIGKNNSYKTFYTMDRPDRKNFRHLVTDHVKELEQASEVIEAYMERYDFDPENLRVFAEIYGDAMGEWMKVVYDMNRKMRGHELFLAETFRIEEDVNPELERIYWMQKRNDAVSVHSKATSSKQILGPLFDPTGERPTSVVAMSATLATSGVFRHIKKDFGITEREDVDELIVDTPFPLSENMLWYLPEGTPPGNQFMEHQRFVFDHMQQMIQKLDGRALCLFTSIKNMREATDRFKKNLPAHMEVLSQATMPRQQIIEQMKNKDHVVAVGTKSLFTGIDVQGQNLSAVFIDKIPFPMMNDPVNDYLANEPKGFFEYSLPESIISIKQGFGRLNRTSEDQGLVILYDGRLKTENYAKRIFTSFTFPLQTTGSAERVEEFIAGLPAPQMKG